MQRLTLGLEGMRDDRCEGKIVAELKKLEGVLLVNISFAMESGVITFNETEVTPGDIVQAISSLGYIVTAKKSGRCKLTKIVFGILVLLALIILSLEMYKPTREFIYDLIHNQSEVEIEITQDDPQFGEILLPEELQR